jgi:hypothetical protein
MSTYFWDENSVRYQLINSIGGSDTFYNWLFFPGGPGADSRAKTNRLEWLPAGIGKTQAIWSNFHTKWLIQNRPHSFYKLL